MIDPVPGAAREPPPGAVRRGAGVGDRRARRGAAAGALAAAGLAAAGLAACAPAHADEPGYELRVVDEVALELGATGSISVAIVPAAGRTVSGDGPVRVAVSAPDGVGLPRRRYARKDAADPAADAPRFDVRLRAREPGDHAVELDVRFWLCGARVCRPITATRTVLARVAAPPPVDAAIDAAAPVDAGVPDARRRR